MFALLASLYFHCQLILLLLFVTCWSSYDCYLLVFVSSVSILHVNPGPHGVSELTYHSNDSTAVWTPTSPQQQAVGFIYELSLKNGTTIDSSRVSVTKLRLLGLEEGKTYVLNVWEECDNQLESERSHLFFMAANSSTELHVRAGRPAHDTGWFDIPLFQ